MIRTSAEQRIPRPPADVFDFVADAANEPAWNADAITSEQVTDGPVGVGTRRRSEYRSVGHVDTEVLTCERPGRLVLRSVARQAEVTLDFRFEPAPEGTLLCVDGEVSLRGALRLAEGAMRGAVERQYAERVAAIRQALDGQA